MLGIFGKVVDQKTECNLGLWWDRNSDGYRKYMREYMRRRRKTKAYREWYYRWQAKRKGIVK
jgi:hypothetical protein